MGVDMQFDVIPSVKGVTIYVGGINPGNFSTIQEGIDAANPGDTVYVYSGLYVENVIVNKTISLVGEDRDTTIINSSVAGNTITITSDWVNITALTITGGGTGWEIGGLFAVLVENCSVYNVNCSFNYGNGIYLYAKNSTIKNSIFSNNNKGMIVSGFWNNISSNEVFSNNEEGIYLCHGKWNDVYDNNCTENMFGIFVEALGDESGYNNITGNDAFSNSYSGIGLVYSDDNRVIGNNCSNNQWYGIFAHIAHNHDIIGNTIITDENAFIIIDFLIEEDCAIDLVETTGITLTNNIMINGGIEINGRNLEQYNSHNIDTTNTVNGKTVHYIKDQNGGIVPPEAGQVILANSQNITIENQELDKSTYGILLGFSPNNSIKNNTISNSWYGIYLTNSNVNTLSNNTALNSTYSGITIYDSDENTLINNEVMNNYCGISISSTSYNDSVNNTIYHNNIINNTGQAGDSHINIWNHSYPLGGNFWSDYTGSDFFSGPNQDVPGSDGIGDFPYIIDSDNQDNYPLMDPIGNLTFLRHGWNQISIPRTQSSEKLEDVLSQINGLYDAVSWYNESDSDDSWKMSYSSKPSHLNDLDSIDHTIGFWIHITKPGGAILEYKGIVPTQNQTIELHAGWNMVGYPSLSNKYRDEALNNLSFGTHVDAIWTYNSGANRWEEVGELNYFVVGKGYWIHAKEKWMWDVPL
jgi:parallel beta-helix repeat protein